MIDFCTDQELLLGLMQDCLNQKIEGECKFFSFSNAEGMAICGTTNYTGYDVDIMVATVGKRPPLRMAWRHLIKYVFKVCKCDRMTSKISGDNQQAIRMNGLGGLTLEGTMRKGDSENGNDVHVFSLLKEETKWASQ